MNKKQFPNFIELMGTTWERFRLHFNGLVGASLISLVGSIILCLVAIAVLFSMGFAFSAMNIDSIGYGIIGVCSIFALVFLVFIAFITLVMQKIALNKKNVSLRATVNSIELRELGRVVATIIIISISIMLGMMALVVPGIIFAVLSVVAWPIMVDKKAGGVLVFAYAYHYIKGSLAAYLLSSIIFTIISIAIYVHIGVTASILWFIIYTPFNIVFGTILYEVIHDGRDLVVSKKSRTKWGIISGVVIIFGAFIMAQIFSMSAHFISSNPNIDVTIDKDGFGAEFNKADLNNGEINPDILPEDVQIDVQ